ncbi:hypothetical protein TcG_11726 [Trypanosoma cruzi]|nr:hypothetical protein TcG_11726 [Trypanosoma cruzi]
MPSAPRRQQQSHEGSIAGSWLPRIIQGNRPWHHDVAVKHEIAGGSNVGASTKVPSHHQWDAALTPCGHMECTISSIELIRPPSPKDASVSDGLRVQQKKMDSAVVLRNRW